MAGYEVVRPTMVLSITGIAASELRPPSDRFDRGLSSLSETPAMFRTHLAENSREFASCKFLWIVGPCTCIVTERNEDKFVKVGFLVHIDGDTDTMKAQYVSACVKAGPSIHLRVIHLVTCCHLSPLTTVPRNVHIWRICSERWPGSEELSVQEWRLQCDADAVMHAWRQWYKGSDAEHRTRSLSMRRQDVKPTGWSRYSW